LQACDKMTSKEKSNRCSSGVSCYQQCQTRCHEEIPKLADVSNLEWDGTPIHICRKDSKEHGSDTCRRYLISELGKAIAQKGKVAREQEEQMNKVTQSIMQTAQAGAPTPAEAPTPSGGGSPALLIGGIFVGLLAIGGVTYFIIKRKKK